MAVSVDTTSSATGSVGTTLSWSHTVNSGDDRGLLVMIATIGSGASAVTFNGDALTQLSGAFGVANTGLRIRGFYMQNPDVTTANIEVTKGSGEAAAATAISFFGAGLSGDGVSQGADAVTSSTLAISPASSGIVADIIATFANTPTANVAQTEFGAQLNFSGTYDMKASYKSVSPGATSMNWTFSTDDYAHAAVLIAEASGGGITFTPKVMMF